MRETKINVWLKEGVSGDLCPEMQEAHGKIVELYRKSGYIYFYVVSRREGDHKPGSLHYIGLAEDFNKVLDVEKEDIEEVLGTDYRVIEKRDYFHVEYNPQPKHRRC